MSDRVAPGASLRRRSARGTIVNATFLLSVNALSLAKTAIVATLISAEEMGIWGMVLGGVTLVMALKAAGVGDKYVQQDEEDGEAAFQKALTLELIYSAALLAVLVAAVPLIGVAYGRSDLLAPAYVLCLVVPAQALQLPVWIFYRRMEFVHQRRLQAIDPIVGFVVAIALAAQGFGEWSLVLALVAGTWASAIAAVIACPYPLRLRYERGTAREYVRFGGPIVLAAIAIMAGSQLISLVGEATMGAAAVGAITLAASLATFGERVDAIVTQTLYPAICAVQDRADLLWETWVKSNRLALMAGLPIAAALALFAGDAITWFLGEQWRPAEVLLVTFAITTAVNQVGFNWSAYYRARGETWPIAHQSLLAFALTVLACVPLLALFGLPGLAAGTGVLAAGMLIQRLRYLRRIFPGRPLVRSIARVAVPSAAAAGIVLVARALETGTRTPATAAAELAIFAVAALALTLVVERSLIREVAGYLRRDPAPAPAGA